VKREQIIIDPGIGFGKTVHHNLQLIRDLDRLRCMERPILLGASRKRFIGSVLDRPVDQREAGTAAVNVCAILNGVHLVRVHDVAAQRDAVIMADALLAAAGARS